MKMKGICIEILSREVSQKFHSLIVFFKMITECLALLSFRMLQSKTGLLFHFVGFSECQILCDSKLSPMRVSSC